MARLITKPVEIQPAQSNDPIYALMSELLDPTVNAEAASSVFCASVVNGGQAKQLVVDSASHTVTIRYERDGKQVVEVWRTQ